jgi:hypothetical protein
VPDREVARVERLVTTWLLGYVISETSGRFAIGDPRERRALLAGVDLPAHRRLATHLETAASWEKEFETALDDMEELIETIANRS